MRVLAIGNMYPPQHLGGYELTWLASTRDLLDAGHDVRVLTTDVVLHPGAEEEHAGVHRELRWYWRDHEWPRLAPRTVVALERHNAATLRRHLHGFRPDVVAVWAMGGMSLGLLERIRAAGLPAVGVVGDDWMIYGPQVDAWTRAHARRPRLGRLTGPLLRLPSRFEPGAVAHWLFNSRTTLSRARQAGHHLPRAEVAHPGIADDLLAAAPRPDWSGRLLCLGRIDPRKGIATAVSALAALPGHTLSVYGGGDEAHLAELRELAHEQGVAERVEFAQVPAHERREVYASHDALLFPVKWVEPWGLVPLEAMGVGLPVIATEGGGPAEYLEHERNALVLPRDAEPAAFAAAVDRLREDAALRERLVAGGRATAARFTERAYNEAIRGALERAVRAI